LKQHTIIFVPHARAKFRKWRLTTLQVSLLVGTLAVLTVGGIVATVLFFNTEVDRDRLAELEKETSALRSENQSFDSTIRDLDTQLKDFQQRIHKLAIVAGVSDLSPASDAGIGGPGEGGMEEQLSQLEYQAHGLDQGLNLLQQRFAEQRLLISSIPAVAPVRGILTSRFGRRRDPFTHRPAFHNGIDIVAPRGKEVRAPGDGLVTKVGRAQGLGNAVYISHGYGLTTRYGHLWKIAVKAGQKVRRGEVIGYVGNSGRSSGYHLHYEVRDGGRPTNPLGYILDSTSP